MLLLAAWLLLSTAPAAPGRAAPSPQDVSAGRAAIAALKAARGTDNGMVMIDNAMLAGIAALAGDASGRRHVDLKIVGGRVQAVASVPLPLGLWVNIRASALPSAQGFPPVDARIGRLPLPRALSRAAIRAALWLGRRRGADLPPLDRLVQRVEIGDGALVARVSLPPRTGLIDTALKAGGSGFDTADAARRYCALIAADRAAGAGAPPRLADQIRRLFADPLATRDAHRARLAALALRAVPERGDDLLPELAAAARRSCPAGFSGSRLADPVLGGRTDLAKHWALSAALTAAFGRDAARAIGQWKELADSLPSGSGFSFVDLAADRSGMHAAEALGNPARAAEAAALLARADDELLLPAALARAPEGLSEAQFLARFGSTESARFNAAARTIDAALPLAPAGLAR